MGESCWETIEISDTHCLRVLLRGWVLGFSGCRELVTFVLPTAHFYLWIILLLHSTFRKVCWFQYIEGIWISVYWRYSYLPSFISLNVTWHIIMLMDTYGVCFWCVTVCDLVYWFGCSNWAFPVLVCNCLWLGLLIWVF